MRAVPVSVPILREGLSQTGADAIAVWIGAALAGRKPKPLLICGEGSSEVGTGLVRTLLSAGRDLLPCPRTWAVRGGRDAPDNLPGMLVLVTNIGDEYDDDRLDALAERCGLLVCGDGPPLLKHCSMHVLDLPAARVADLRVTFPPAPVPA